MCLQGRLGDAMVLGKLAVATSLDNSRARAYCTCSKYGGDCLEIFFLSSDIFFFFLAR